MSAEALKFFTTTELGEKRQLTPEGFLICLDVPIARTGEQKYLANEIDNVKPDPYGVIIAERAAADVFRPETIASFQGKPVTWGHPAGFVYPHNYRALAIGHVLNARRGQGDDNDAILADLLITDLAAIADLSEEPKDRARTQVSSGYEAEYEEITPGRARCMDIIGNHVAVVPRGRCGERCSIGDENTMADPNKKRSRMSMISDLLTSVFGTTADPAKVEKFNDALTQLTHDAEGEGGEGGMHMHVHLPEKDADEYGARMDKLEERIAALEAKGKTSDEEAEKERKEKEEADKKKAADEAAAEEEKKKKEAEEEEKKKGTKDAQTVMDSAALSDEFQSTVALAEILVPGIRLPKFDAKKPATETADAIVDLRRRTLDAAYQQDEGRKIITDVLGGKALDTKTMEGAALALAFNGSASMKKTINNSRARTTDSARGATAGPPKTLAELNAANRKHYGQPAS